MRYQAALLPDEGFSRDLSFWTQWPIGTKRKSQAHYGTRITTLDGTSNLMEGWGDMDEKLRLAIDRAREWERNATPEQKAQMYRKHRESWMRAFAPCEHGDYDWETCPQCLADFAAKRGK
jgi:hypothetical protein